jgi:hypothetical protein
MARRSSPQVWAFGSRVAMDEDALHEFKSLCNSRRPLDTLAGYVSTYACAFLNSVPGYDTDTETSSRVLEPGEHRREESVDRDAHDDRDLKKKHVVWKREGGDDGRGAGGGVLLLGVEDDGTVIGFPAVLDRRGRDLVRLRVDAVVRSFTPQVDPELVSVEFIPVSFSRMQQKQKRGKKGRRTRSPYGRGDVNVERGFGGGKGGRKSKRRSLEMAAKAGWDVSMTDMRRPVVTRNLTVLPRRDTEEESRLPSTGEDSSELVRPEDIRPHEQGGLTVAFRPAPDEPFDVDVQEFIFVVAVRVHAGRAPVYFTQDGIAYAKMAGSVVKMGSDTLERRTSEGRPTVPGVPPPREFIGRHRELATIREFVLKSFEESDARAAVCVLHGNPVVGKSSLARRLCHEFSSYLPDFIGSVNLEVHGDSKQSAMWGLICGIRPDLQQTSLNSMPISDVEDIYQACFAGKSGILLLESAGRPTSDFLRDLVPRLSKRVFLLVTAHNDVSEAFSDDSPLNTKSLSELESEVDRRTGDVVVEELHLGPLCKLDAIRLLLRVLNCSPKDTSSSESIPEADIQLYDRIFADGHAHEVGDSTSESSSSSSSSSSDSTSISASGCDPPLNGRSGARIPYRARELFFQLQDAELSLPDALDIVSYCGQLPLSIKLVGSAIQRGQVGASEVAALNHGDVELARPNSPSPGEFDLLNLLSNVFHDYDQSVLRHMACLSLFKASFTSRMAQALFVFPKAEAEGGTVWHQESYAETENALGEVLAYGLVTYNERRGRYAEGLPPGFLIFPNPLLLRQVFA